MLPTLRRTAYVTPFEQLQRELDQAFGRAWGRDLDGGTDGAVSYPVDIHEHGDHFTVDAELPGFKRDQIHVTLEQGVLTIKAEREDEPQEGQSHLNERRYARLSRSFRLGTALDEGKVDATYENGVLHLKLPKREEVQPRRIDVK